MSECVSVAASEAEKARVGGASRGQVELPSDAVDAATKIFDKVMENMSLVAPAAGVAVDVKNMFEATIFGISPGTRSCLAEKMHLPALRYQATGTRRILVVDEAGLYKYWRMAHVSALTEPSFPDLWRFFEKFDRKGLQDFNTKVPSCLHHYTLSAGDIVILPAGVAIADEVQGQEVCTGIRWSFCMNDSGTRKTLQQIIAHFETIGGAKGPSKQHQALSAILPLIRKETNTCPSENPTQTKRLCCQRRSVCWFFSTRKEKRKGKTSKLGLIMPEDL